MKSVHAKQDYTSLSVLGTDHQLSVDEDLLFDVGSAIEEDRTPQRHTVMLGSVGLVLPANEISELIERVAVCRLPNTRSWFSGVIGVRGNMIPVFDLHNLFSIERPESNRRLIVVGQNESAAAFWVDITTDTPLIPDMIREHAQRYFLKDGQVWVEWEFKSFFAALGEQL